MDLKIGSALALLATPGALARGEAVRFTLDRAEWEARTTGRMIVTTFDEDIWPVEAPLEGDWTVGGVTYRGHAGTPFPNIYVMVADPPLSGQSLTTNGDEDNDVEPLTPVTALGFEVEVNHFGPVTIRVYDEEGVEVARTEIPAGTVGFFGITADGPFGLVNFRSVRGALVNSYLDTVTLASAIDGCIADFNGDGTPNIFDFLAFQTAFGNEDRRADLDGSGVLNVFDFLAFQTAFGNEC